MRSETTTKPIRDLVLAFSRGEILLPQFQRDYVWKPLKIRNLLDSLFHDLPIGGFYLWQPSGNSRDVRPKKFGEQVVANVAPSYLIDGQQRLTSLEAAFGLFTGEDKHGEELQCYLDLTANEQDRVRDTKLFVSYAGRKSISNRVDRGDPTLISIETFLKDKIDQSQRTETEKLLKSLSGWDHKRVARAMDRYDRAHRMLNQQVPCTTVHEVNDEEAVEIFRRLNRGGNALREGDVRAAELARGPAVAVLKEMRDFVNEELPLRLGFGFSFAFRCLVVFHRGSAQFKSLPTDWITIPGPHGRPLGKSWQATRSALIRALTFVDEQMGWSRREFVPSANALIVLAFTLDGMEEAALPEKATRNLRSWLALTALRGVFRGSVETTINQFVKALREPSPDPSQSLLNALKRNEARKIQPEEFTQVAQLWGPGTQVLHSWLVNRTAKDWLNGESLDALARSNSLGLAGGDLTVHHIFPRAPAGKMFVNPNDVNCLANFAIISRESNSKINDEWPNDVLDKLDAEARKRAATQFFSTEAGDRLRPESYEEFRQWRAKKLADAFNEEFGRK